MLDLSCHLSVIVTRPAGFIFRCSRSFEQLQFLFCPTISHPGRKCLLQCELLEIDQSVRAQCVLFPCLDGSRHRASLGSARRVNLTKRRPFKPIGCKGTRFLLQLLRFSHQWSSNPCVFFFSVKFQRFLHAVNIGNDATKVYLYHFLN